jgi:hypothetical protein
VRYVVATLAVVLTAAGLSRPEFAGRALQLLIAGVTFAVVTSIVASRWNHLAPSASGAFVPPDPQLTSGTETLDVIELRNAIESSKGRLPRPVARVLADACRGRLADRHRLQLHVAGDRGQIERLVSPTMWVILDADPEEDIAIPIHTLPRLLDEVEAL